MNVKICSSCEGTGTIKNYEYNRGEYSYNECERCKGKGRVWYSQYILESPYDYKYAERIELDSEIVRKINDFKYLVHNGN